MTVHFVYDGTYYGSYYVTAYLTFCLLARICTNLNNIAHIRKQ